MTFFFFRYSYNQLPKCRVETSQFQLQSTYNNFLHSYSVSSLGIKKRTDRRAIGSRSNHSIGVHFPERRPLRRSFISGNFASGDSRVLTSELNRFKSTCQTTPIAINNHPLSFYIDFLSFFLFSLSYENLPFRLKNDSH